MQAIWHTGGSYRDERSVIEKFTQPTPSPRKLLTHSIFKNTHIRKILPGSDFVVLITEKNELYVFGENGPHHLLGLKDISQISNLDHIPVPIPHPDLKGIQIKDAEIGWGHTLALTDDNKVYSWGSNVHGQCGLDRRDKVIASPTLISAFKGVEVVQIACGETHSMARDKDGNVYTWGSHHEGKLGVDPIKDDSLVPVQVTSLNGNKIIHISSGTDHSAALSESGDVFVWGFGQHGALSIVTSFKNAYTPVKLSLPAFLNVDYSKKYPYIVDGYKVKEGQFKELFYNQHVIDVKCGMDFTILVVENSPKSELSQKIDQQHIQINKT